MMRVWKWMVLVLAAGLLLAPACDPARPPVTPEPEGEQPGEGEGEPGEEPVVPAFYTYQVVNVYPHDPQAFTQGLDYADGFLYEGTGLNGRSSLRRVIPETGDVVKQIDLDRKYFGEGIVVVGDRIVQLTWQSRVGFVYDRDSFVLQRTFNYPTEGWGITHDGNRYIMSDGTSTLYFLDAETFERTGSVQVMDRGKPVIRLNELEYIDGAVYANVWQKDYIVAIDPATGTVTARIDLTGLLDTNVSTADVLNGIAYDEENGRLFVTGKLWPRLYEIILVPKP
jgi:glutamine cyclotransferase